jgi:hypothetical protein
MKAILRFKESVHDLEAGALMQAGAELKPDPGALQRVAQRLGVSGAALAAAQAATVKAAAEVGAAATASGTTAFGNGAGSLFAISAAKGLAIGLCLSAAAYVGVHLPKAATSPAPALVSASSPHVDPNPEALVVTQPAGSVPGAAHGEEESVSSGRRTPSMQVQPSDPPASAVRRSSAALVGSAPIPAPVLSVATVPQAPESPPAVATAGVSPGAGAYAAGSVGSARAADPRVMQEVVSLDRVRALAKQGNAALALRELDDFDRVFGYRVLLGESMLVRIDVLLSLGKRQAAAAIARQLLAAGAPATQRQRLTVLANSGMTIETPATNLK